LLIVIHTRIDQVMIGQMLNEVQVGLYSAAIRISEAWLFVPGLVVQTAMPYFVQLREQNPGRYRQRLMQVYSVMFWTGVAAGITATLLGRPAIALLFGKAYSGAYGPLVFTIWTGIFIAQAIARGIWMVSENLQRYRLFNNLVAVPINVGLNLVWIPEYGITGAAMASLVSVSVGTWIVPLFFSPLRQSNLDMMRSVNPRYLFIKG
jgi:O-antigen/teichoic acid export membrane protein